MEPKKIAMILAIAILLPLCIGLLVDAVYSEPKYEDYCKYNYYTPYKEVNQNITCPVVYENQDYQECEKIGGLPIIDYDQNNCQIFKECNLCSLKFQENLSKYNQNLFFILSPIALFFIIFGILLTIEYLGAGFMFGGLILLFYATVRYFSDMSKLFRAIVILIEFLIILIIGYKKIDKENRLKEKERKKK